jgi:ADP-ribosylglycohydrolase
MPDSAHDRLERAHASLAGLSVGDAFGECLFEDPQGIDLRLLPRPRWLTTDDTEMAIAIVDVLERHERMTKTGLRWPSPAAMRPIRIAGTAPAHTGS